MATAVATATTYPAAVLRSCTTHYGLQVCDVGEDGDVLVLGHHDDRRTIAAIARHQRRQAGLLPDDIGGVEHLRLGLERRWCQLVYEGCGCTVVDPSRPDDPCPDCDYFDVLDDDDNVTGRELEPPVREYAWTCDWYADANHPGAFPITLSRA